MAKAEDNLFNLQMCSDKQFTTFIICFEKEVYETGWNYNMLCNATNPRPPNPALPATPGARPSFVRILNNSSQTPGPRPPAQLNASDTIEALEPNPDGPVNPNSSVNDSTFPEDEEALQANRFRSSNKLWIDVPLDVQERCRKEGACI
ncbi:hypothetical protein C0992_003731, partial [Termitomyces sp. T32_za158]